MPHTTKSELLEEVNRLRRRVEELERQQKDESKVAGTTDDRVTMRRLPDESHQDSENRYRTLLDTISLGIQEFDASGVITFVNPAYSKMLGYENGELVGKRIFDLLDNEAEQDELRKYLAYLVSEQPARTPYFGRNQTKGGSVIDIQVDWTYNRDETGKVTGFTSVITERDWTDYRFETLFKMSPDAVMFADSERQITMNNPAVIEMFGYSDEELIGKTTEMLYPNKQAFDDQGKRRFRKGSATDKSFYEVQYKRKDGSIFWTESHGTQIKDDEGNVIGFMGLFRDITERKQIEAELIKRTQQFHTLTMLAPVGIFETDAQGNSVFVNEAVCSFSGMAANQHDGAGWATSLHSEDYQRVTKLWLDVVSGNGSFETEFRFVGENGKVTWLASQSATLRDEDANVTGFIGTLTNITELKEAEESLKKTHDTLERRVEERTVELRENNRRLHEEIEIREKTEQALNRSKKHLQDIIDSLFGFIGLYTTDGIIIEVNKAPLDAAGLKKEDVIGKPFWETYWWSYSPDVQDQLKKALRNAASGETVRYDVPVRVADNQFIVIDVMFGPLYDNEGNISQLLGFGVDITDRKRTEQQFAQLVEFAPEAMVIVNDNREITLINEQAERLFGYRREELLGKLIEVLLPEGVRDEHEILVAGFFAQPTLRGMGSNLKLYARRKDGTEFRVEISLSPIESEGNPLVIATIRDITERVRAEEEIRQYREQLAHVVRLSTMGEMATGLAHELNQPLTAISTFCHVGHTLADTEPENPEQLRELFVKSERQAMRAGDIIRRLRALVSKRTAVRSPVDLIKGIENVLQLLETDLHQSEVCVEQQMDLSSCIVIIDEIQIQQVFVNLIRNSLDAMTETDRAQRKLKISTVQTADGMIKVAICDAGKGVPLEKQDQVFDAFFTTKSEGMGMGLAISRTIIESHDGQLWMTPNSDRGVTFHMTLPISKEVSDDDGK